MIWKEWKIYKKLFCEASRQKRETQQVKQTGKQSVKNNDCYKVKIIEV